MNTFYIISLIILIMGIILIFTTIILDKYKKKTILETRKINNYAILIPARNESNVIENLLISISKQTNLDSTYVIVENNNDKTIEITKKYGGNIIVREDLEGKRKKGYALDEAIKKILKTKTYDIYFIFDADNILDKDFIANMITSYENGYDICTGYRNIKNNVNKVTSCSGLTFSMINNIFNKAKVKNNKTIIISGTGYYIAGSLINKWQGFPFNSLTEDYELSLYAAKHNINTFYNEQAIFYDEQPDDIKTSKKQRLRWIKGFLDSRKKYIKEIEKDYTKLIGITPYLLIILSILIFIITTIIELIINISNNSLIIKRYLFLILIFPIILYLLLFMFTYIIIINEDNKINLSFKDKVIAMFYNPIFLLQYIPLFFKALFIKDLKWDVIKHKSK